MAVVVVVTFACFGYCPACVCIYSPSFFIFLVCLSHKVNRRCQEMSTGVSGGATSAKQLLSEASEALESALSVQRAAVQEWEEQVLQSTAWGEMIE